jgi:aldehyde dehydrogenase (NAD+)
MEEININSLFSIQKSFFSTQKSRPINFRLEKLRLLKKSILTFEEEIYAALYADLKKSKEESFFSEIGIVLNELDYFISKLNSWSKPTRVSTPIFLLPSKSYIQYDPLGLCLIIAPFNYPFQLALLPLIGAIGSGNCAIVKGSEHTPNTNEVLKKIFSSFDSDHLAFLCGDAEQSRELVKLPFDKIFFTGSTAVGKKVLAAAAENLTPVVLELGGKSPCIVDKSADIKLSARRIVWGKFMNAGQTCIAPDFVLVHTSVHDALINAMIKEIEELYGVDSSLSPHYGKIIHEKAWDRLVDLIDENKVKYGGKFDKSTLFISPTILDNVEINDKCMREEIFGPILPILTYENEEDLPIFLSKEKPLAMYVFGSISWAQSIINKFPSGGACINDTMIHFSNSKLPFGGIGASGLGHYHGYTSFLCFSHQRSIMQSFTWIDLFFRYPPFRHFALIKHLFRF